MKPSYLLIVLVILLSGCCESKYLGEVKLSPNQKAVNPYAANDTIVFTDFSNDTCRFIVQWRTSKMVYRDDGGCADCCADYCDAEMDLTWITSDCFSASIGVTLYFPDPFSPWSQANPMMSFSFMTGSDQESPIGTAFPELPVNDLDSFAVVEWILHETLILGTEIFENVYSIPGHCYYPDSMHCDTLFYSNAQGVVGIAMSDGNLFIKQ